MLTYMILTCTGKVQYVYMTHVVTRGRVTRLHIVTDKIRSTALSYNVTYSVVQYAAPFLFVVNHKLLTPTEKYTTYAIIVIPKSVCMLRHYVNTSYYRYTV